ASWSMATGARTRTTTWTSWSSRKTRPRARGAERSRLPRPPAGRGMAVQGARPEGRLDRRDLRAHDRPGHRRAALTRRDGRGARDPRAGALPHRRADEQAARAPRAQPRLRADARDRAV